MRKLLISYLEELHENVALFFWVLRTLGFCRGRRGGGKKYNFFKYTVATSKAKRLSKNFSTVIFKSASRLKGGFCRGVGGTGRNTIFLSILLLLPKRSVFQKLIYRLPDSPAKKQREARLPSEAPFKKLLYRNF